MFLNLNFEWKKTATAKTHFSAITFIHVCKKLTSYNPDKHWMVTKKERNRKWLHKLYQKLEIRIKPKKGLVSRRNPSRNKAHATCWKNLVESLCAGVNALRNHES